MRSFFLLLAAFGLLAGTTAHAAHAAQKPLYSLTEEDDGIFTHQDRHYTQGFVIARSLRTQPDTLWGNLGQKFSTLAGWLGAGKVATHRYSWPLVGQSMFTPTDTKTFTPDPHDRPYAGWLYVGAALTQTDRQGRTDQLQVLVGDVGSWALARQVQNGFHTISGYGKANGWNHQLHNEPALLLQYQVKWDFKAPQFGPIEADALPMLNVTLGNVLTYGAAGLTLRVGQGLATADTPRTITPGLSGTGWFDPSKMNSAFGWFLYCGFQERVMWRNIFLQGNSWQNSPGVPMKHYVNDEDVGVALLFRFGLRVDITYVKRSREFSGQLNDDRFGSITLSAPL